MAQSVFELFAKIGLDSSGFVQGLNNAKSMATKIGGGIKAGLGAIATASAAAFTAASAATTKFVSDSVKTGMEFDSSMSQVAATMGKTVDEMLDDVQTVEIRGKEFTGNLREYAMKMGKETAFSAKEAADALNYMALAGYDTKTSMEMLPNVLNLAAAGDMNLATASDMVTDTQTAFGISLERTTQMVDEMAKAASTGNTNVQQLGDAFLTVGGLASELNGGFVKLSDGTKASVDGIQELEIALTAMANAGIKGSEAGTHMRNMLLKLSSPTDEATQKLEAMGVNVFDKVSGNMRTLNDIFSELSGSLERMTQQEKIQTISELFNARDLSSAEALLNAVSQDWNKIGESILNAQYNFSEVNAALKDSGIAWEKYSKTAWMDNGGIASLTEQIKYNLKDQQKSVEETANFIASEYDMSMADAAKAVLTVKDTLTDAGGAAEEMAKTQLENLAGDMKLFNSAMEYAKITISDSLSPALREFVQFGTEGVQKLADAFAEGGFEKALETLKPILKDGIGMITRLLPDAINVVTTLIDAVIDNLPEIMETALPALVTAISDVFTSLVKQIPKLLPAMISVGQAVLKEIPNVLDIILQSIPKLLESMDGTGILDSLVQFFVDIANTLAKNAAPIAQALANAIPAIINGLVKSLPEIISAVGTVFESISDAIYKDDGVLDAFVVMISSIVDGITENIDDILIAFKGLYETMFKKMSEPETVEKLSKSAGKILTKVFVGAVKVLGSATAWLFDLSYTIGKAIGDALVDPKFYAEIANSLKELGKGILEGFGLDTSVWDEYFEDLGEKAYDTVQKIGEDWDKFWSDLAEGFVKIVDGIKETIAGIPEKFTELIGNAKKWGKDLIDNFVSGLVPEDATEGIAAVAQKIVDFIGFSEPKEGPLSKFHTFAPDMIDMFVSGLEQNTKKVEEAFKNTFSLPDLEDKSIEQGIKKVIIPAFSESADKVKGSIFNNIIAQNIFRKFIIIFLFLCKVLKLADRQFLTL